MINMRAIAVAALCFGAALTGAQAQTPSPLNFWQFSAGQVLAPYDDQGPEWLVLVGPSIVYQPQYEGSRHYEVQAGAVIDVRYRGRLYLSTGEGVGYDFLRSPNYRIGAGISYDIGRNQHKNGVRGLGNIDPTPQAKVYGDFVFRPHLFGHQVPVILSVDVRRAIGEYNGLIANVGTYVPIAGSEKDRYFVFLGASGTYWDTSTAKAYFAVTPAQSASSGLPVYTTRAGPESFGVGVSSGWFITDHWLVTGDMSVKRILSDFNESPIVQEPWQGLVTVSVAYNF